MEVLERTGSKVVLQLDSDLYGEAVVFKCFYWYGDRFEVEIDKDTSSLRVSLVPKDGMMSDERLEAVIARVRRDLIDFKTRDIVSRETRVVRELLIAKAFAHSDEFDQPPPGSVADPLGLTPTT